MSDPFHVRFNIDVPVAVAHDRFINRIENRVRMEAQCIEDFSQGQHINYFDPLMIQIETALGKRHGEFISRQGDFVLAWRVAVGPDFYRCLQAIEALCRALDSITAQLSYRVSKAVIETIDQSEIDLGISWQGGIFVKKGAELLDDKLVNEPLKWLAEPNFGNVLIPFKKGLTHLLEGAKDPQRFGDAVTDCYEALEAMAKIVTGKPTRELSALREEFVANLRLPETHRRMLKEYIDYGCEFRHAIESGQKRSWPLEHEAENFVYLTGMFIRLAIQSESVSAV